jgi:long-chain acyl-CoA synthetase
MPVAPSSSVAGAIRVTALRAPGAPAVSQGARTLSFGGLLERAERVASGVSHGLGLAPGARAVVFAPNCLEYLELVLGLSEARVSPVLATATLAPRELALVCNDCEARVLFVHPMLEEVARSAELETVERIVVLGEHYETWLTAAHPGRPEQSPSGEEPFLLRYTSGTTGEPKGAVISQRATVARLGVHAATFGIESPAECSLAVAPLSAGTAMTQALATLLAGGSCVAMPMFHPEAVVRELESGSVTQVAFVPTHVRSILGLPQEKLCAVRANRLRVLAVGGAALSPAESERVAETFGAVLHIPYGSTETGTISLLRPRDVLRKAGSVGTPFPGTEVRIVRDDGAEADPGEPGELHVRSAIMFDGYWGRPEETASAFVDGFYATGDVGRRDEEGYLYLLGRVDDRINSGGLSFYPSEVEEVLLGHPGVADVVAYPVADDRLGEAVHALVVQRAGASDGERALLAYAAGLLATERRPKRIEFVEALPRTPAGKLSRRALRDRDAPAASDAGR